MYFIYMKAVMNNIYYLGQVSYQVLFSRFCIIDNFKSDFYDIVINGIWSQRKHLTVALLHSEVLIILILRKRIFISLSPIAEFILGHCWSNLENFNSISEFVTLKLMLMVVSGSCWSLDNSTKWTFNR